MSPYVCLTLYNLRCTSPTFPACYVPVLIALSPATFYFQLLQRQPAHRAVLLADEREVPDPRAEVPGRVLGREHQLVPVGNEKLTLISRYRELLSQWISCQKWPNF